MTTIVSGPKIDQRPEMPYMGIRTQTPMSAMSKTVTKLFKEINAWARGAGVVMEKPPFLRYHVIDMEGAMDIEVGFPVAAPLPESILKNGLHVCPGVIPAGRYASLIYIGNGYTGNKTLIEWAKANGIPWDRWDDPKGDGFRARYESYLTDPQKEPRKTKWEVEVAIKLPDDYRG